MEKGGGGAGWARRVDVIGIVRRMIEPKVGAYVSLFGFEFQEEGERPGNGRASRTRGGG